MKVIAHKLYSNGQATRVVLIEGLRVPGAFFRLRGTARAELIAI
jgi:hypothetical protein